MKFANVSVGGLAAIAIVGIGMNWGDARRSFMANAATPTTQPAPTADEQRPRTGPPRGERRRPGAPGIQRAIDQLELTDSQKPAIDAEVKAYRQKEQKAREELLKAMKETLTSEQYEKFASAITQPPPPPGGEEPNQPPPPSEREQQNQPVAQPAVAVVKPDGSSEIAVTFSGGYETDPRDGGRPVVLIAAALNVSSDVFRKAFSGVTPAGPGEQPQDAQVRLNKQALMRVLAPYGITNEQLDTVSNYYRYSGSRGQMWRNTPATATATIRNGVVTGFTITNAGAGYSSSPKVSIPGMAEVKAEVKLAFGTDFKTNGSIREIAIAAK